MTRWLANAIASAWIAAFTTAQSPESLSNEITLSVNNLAQVTYASHLGIASDRARLEVALLDYKLFERELSQYIPLLVSSGYQQEREFFSDRSREYEMEAGTQKEFFNGTRLRFASGARGSVEGDLSRSPTYYATAEARFPLAGSATRLRRVVARTFEENELLDAQLEYVDTVQERIEDAYDEYFEYIEELTRLEAAKANLDQYRDWLERGADSWSALERDELESEIEIGRSRIEELQERVATSLMRLAERVGLATLTPSHVRRYDLLSAQPYGIHFLDLHLNELIEQAEVSDPQLRLLHISRSNAEWKLELARKGKWDISARLFTSVERANRRQADRSEAYRAGVLFDVKRFDPKLLTYARRKALEEIRMFESEIAHRLQELRSDLSIQYSQGQAFLKQLPGSRRSLELVRQIANRKAAAALQDQESVDNLIDAHENVLRAEDELFSLQRDLLEVIVEIEAATGAFFKRLGIDLEDSAAEFAQHPARQ